MLSDGIRETATLQALHLLFKWNADREPNTIQLHKEVADKNGSVWWGRFGQAGSTGMGKAKLSLLQHQLDGGVVTHAFLYRRGEIWQTTLEAITTSPDGVDDQRMAGYYTKDECNLFARISNFVNLPVDWALKNLVPANSRSEQVTRCPLQSNDPSIHVRTEPGGRRFDAHHCVGSA